MDCQLRLDNFSGPFDLLCHLIETAELDICTISLAQVVDQYIAYVAQAEKYADLDTIGEFLVLAVRLLLLKTQVLLPTKKSAQLEQEESIIDEEAEQLVKHLEQYRRFRDLGRRLGQIMEAEADYQAIGPILSSEIRSPIIVEPPSLDLTALMSAWAYLQPLLARVQTVTVRPNQPTVEEEMASLTSHIDNGRPTSFRRYLGPKPSLYRLVTAFLALLELWRQSKITIEQDGRFGDIFIVGREDPG
ncbi:MAG: segregation/condensation protein A [Firmicutes bacterium]|nr:segregation/condensation protein A [Bacillota bacterium]